MVSSRSGRGRAVTDAGWERIPLLVVKLNETLVGFTVQLPLPLPPTVKLTGMVSAVPVVGVTVMVP